MKFKNIILVGSVTLIAYSIYDFLNKKENQEWIQDIDNSTENILNKYDNLSKKFDKVLQEKQKVIIPVMKELSKNLKDFTYITNLKLEIIEKNLAKVVMQTKKSKL
ncbi:MAG: hypothetical protein ACRCZW_02910 [Lactobacillaceae bacterium]